MEENEILKSNESKEDSNNPVKKSWKERLTEFKSGADNKAKKAKNWIKNNKASKWIKGKIDETKLSNFLDKSFISSAHEIIIHLKDNQTKTVWACLDTKTFEFYLREEDLIKANLIEYVENKKYGKNYYSINIKEQANKSLNFKYDSNDYGLAVITYTYCEDKPKEEIATVTNNIGSYEFNILAKGATQAKDNASVAKSTNTEVSISPTIKIPKP